MSETSLIRTLRFTASHHYRRSEWTEEENLRTFGENVRSHEHDWSVDVQVGGDVDPRTGFLVDLGALDAAIEEVVGPLARGDLNVAIPEVADGRMLPSTESLAGWLFDRLAPRIPAPARLERVRVREGDALASEARAPGLPA